MFKPRIGVFVSFTAAKRGRKIKKRTGSSFEEEKEYSEFEVTPSAIHLVQKEADEVSEDDEEEEDLDAPLPFEEFVAGEEVYVSDDDTENCD